MKLLFDESLSPKLVALLTDLSQAPKAHLEMVSPVPDSRDHMIILDR